MQSYQKEKSIFITPHRKGTAGYRFDELFSNNTGASLFQLKKGGFFFRLSVFFLSFFLGPFMGVWGALSFSRFIFITPFLRQFDKVYVSRSLIFFAPFFCKKVEYVLHNIESLYYYEEYKSESRILKKIAFLHQSFVLKIFEFSFSTKTAYHCLSKTEFRFLRKSGIKSFFSKSYLFSKVINSSIPDAALVKKRCFFGSYDNVRNIVLATQVVNAFDDVVLFGRRGDLLPENLRNKYLGEIEDLQEIASRYLLTLLSVPRAGVQTKVIDWIEFGGEIDVPNKLYLRMGL